MGSIDPFDIDWKVNDPLDREIVMLKSVKNARASKHAEPPEYLSTEDVKSLVSDPDRIDESSHMINRSMYYCFDDSMDHRCARAVVDFSESPARGVVVSWSRYKNAVSSSGVIYWKDEQ